MCVGSYCENPGNQTLKKGIVVILMSLVALRSSIKTYSTSKLFKLSLLTIGALMSTTGGGASASNNGFPIVGPESLMTPKAHGTCPTAVQSSLRWGCNNAKADEICCFNRHYAEHSGYWTTTSFLTDMKDKTTPTIFYDSVTGKPLFTAPKDRTFDEFVKESNAHGWPSFRDSEVHWENVRCLTNGETVSVDGTHLGK